MTAFATAPARVRGGAHSVLTLRPFWLLLATAAAVSALWVAASREYVPYGAVPVALVIASATVLLAAIVAPSQARGWLSWLTALSFAVHIVALVAVHVWIIEQQGTPVLYPDERTYAAYSQYFADVIRAGDIPDFRARNPGYYAIVTSTFLALGDDTFWARIANVGAASFLVVPVYGLATATFGSVVGRRSAILVGFAPMMLTFPALLFKDLYVAVLVALIAWKWVEVDRGIATVRNLLFIMCAAAITLSFRLETASIMLIVPAMWMLISRVQRHRLPRLAGVLGMLVVAGMVMAASGLGGVLGIENLGPSALESRQNLSRTIVAQRADDASLIAQFVFAESLVERMISVPAFVAQPLVQPIPAFSSVSSTVMAPAMLFSYVALPFAAYGTWRCLRTGARESFMVWGVVAVLLLSSYLSLFVAFRFRIQYEPLLMILAVVGFADHRRIAPWLVPAYIVIGGLMIAVYVFIKVIGLS
ncbi:MAG: hypothetical protein WD734_00085 [Dehalococcoidia bacterium]